MVVFSNLLDVLLTNYIQHRHYDDQTAVQVINLFADSIYIFKDMNFVTLNKHIQDVCTKSSFSVQAAFFIVWQQFMKNKESEAKIIEFVFQDFNSLIIYMRDHVKVVTHIRVDDDRRRLEILENLLSIFKEIIDIDFLFVFSKGDQIF